MKGKKLHKPLNKRALLGVVINKKFDFYNVMSIYIIAYLLSKFNVSNFKNWNRYS